MSGFNTKECNNNGEYEITFYSDSRDDFKTVENLCRSLIGHNKPNAEGDAISREALKDIAYINKGNFNTIEGIREWIDNAPAIHLPNNQIAWEQGYEAGLAQGKHDRQKGEWIGDTDFNNTCKCSKCRMTFDTDRLKMVMCDGKYELPPCCPNCGAEMQKGGAE